MNKNHFFHSVWVSVSVSRLSLPHATANGNWNSYQSVPFSGCTNSTFFFPCRRARDMLWWIKWTVHQFAWHDMKWIRFVCKHFYASKLFVQTLVQMTGSHHRLWRTKIRKPTPNICTRIKSKLVQLFRVICVPNSAFVSLSSLSAETKLYIVPSASKYWSMQLPLVITCLFEQNARKSC